MKWEGKGYNINGNLEYEIKDGNGKFKEFELNGKLLFEGEIMKGKKQKKMSYKEQRVNLFI